MSENIKGKVVVITGASSGLGEAAARLLSTQGARLARGGEALAVVTDVTDRDEVKGLVGRGGEHVRARRCDGQQRRADAAIALRAAPDRAAIPVDERDASI
jgi:NAD(P)-dependent dehydrogenase (short-subunit alcohol dehydrogenase family)